jgi:hypothetical protein
VNENCDWADQRLSSIQKRTGTCRSMPDRVRISEGEVIYSLHEPLLPCGARLVIKTESEPEVIE